MSTKPNEPTHPAKPATPVVAPVATNPLLRSQAAVDDAARVAADEEKKAHERAAAQKTALKDKDPVVEQKTAIDRALDVRDSADDAILDAPAKRERERAEEKFIGQGSDEEKRSGQIYQPPTPRQQIQSHEPGQAAGPNQTEQERTDKGVFKDPTKSEKDEAPKHNKRP